MAYLDHQEAFDRFKDGVVKGLESSFPLVGKDRTLLLSDITVDSSARSAEDLHGQYKAKVSGQTYAAPVHGIVTLQNKITGQVIDKRKVLLAEIPVLTKRYSYIVDGQEYQVDNQWRLKPGVYTRRKNNGELEAQFNVQGSSNFNMVFDPAKKEFSLEYNKSKIPLYPLLSAFGTSDEELKKSWGADILAANKAARGAATALEKFFKADTGKQPTSPEEALAQLRTRFAAAKMDPKVNERHLGIATENLNGQTLHLASSRILAVHGGAAEDDRDSLLNKDLYSIGDYAAEKLKASMRVLKTKVDRRLNQSDSVRGILKFDSLNQPIKEVFRTQLARSASQVNPLEMLSGHLQTTIMGPGGIRSDQAVTDAAKMVNSSHFGYLDPVNTPECYHPDTEVFTSQGWIPWPLVTKNHLFACLIDGRLEFHPPERVVAAPYRGELYGLDTDLTNERGAKSLRYLVTPNHRIWSRPMEGAGYRITTPDEVHGRERVFQTGHAPFLGEDIEYIKLPEPPKVRWTASKDLGLLNIVDWAEFLGWYISEGSLMFKEKEWRYHVRLHQSEVSGDGCAQIEALLDRLGFHYNTDSPGGGSHTYKVSSRRLACYLAPFGLSHEKYLPEQVFTWPLAARQSLLAGLFAGDGRCSQTRGKNTYANWVYTTTSPQLAADVERLLVSVGIPSRVLSYEDKREERYKDVYEVRAFQTPERTVQRRTKGSFFKTAYKGMVYCATVPGGLLYVRMRGSIGHWSGNSGAGITLRLPLGVKKVGKQPMLPLYSLRTGKIEYVDPQTMVSKKVVLPDQVEWVDGKPRPLHGKVAVFGDDNRKESMALGDADYVMRHASQAFTATPNILPFVGNNSGPRVQYASKHVEQAISLRDREAPLVQTKTGVGEGTFHELFGHQAAHVTPAAGTVTKVTSSDIHVRDAKGVEHKVPLYDHFPLNDAKGVLHSEPVVKVGDKVQTGQLLADVNFTKGGALALGTHLRAAYMPYRGLNFEDAAVISASAAKKLTSVHLHKPTIQVEDDFVFNTRKFRIEHPSAFKPEQFEKLDADGVVKVGQVVHPGDPLIVAMRPFDLKDRAGISAVRKSLSGAHTDASLRWHGETAGTVMGVHRAGKFWKVHVKTLEPMQVGDKISVGGAGAKGIVSEILPDDQMPKNKDGQHAEVLLNTFGVGGRMNPGQLYELLAGKIAQKTGKTYRMENFSGTTTDWHDRLGKELKEHGLSDTEELTDPKTGKSFGQVLFGPSYVHKLVHQADKKLSARAGMTLPGLGVEEGYDRELQPTSGGHEGGQSIGALGVYALLAHGATCFLGSTQIWCKGNKKRTPISDIVRNRKTPLVMSWSFERKRLEWKRVVAWKVGVADPNALVEVVYQARTASGNRGLQHTKCTEGHNFFTTRGKVHAADLKPGDRIYQIGHLFHPLQRQLLLGSLLGDGSLSKNEKQPSSFFCAHGAKQAEYLQLKWNILQQMCPSGVEVQPPRKDRYAHDEYLRMRTAGTGELSDLRDLFYPGGKKVVPQEALDEMNEVALAFWVLDDGDTSVVDGKYRCVRLHTEGFGREDVERLALWLQSRWGITAKPFRKKSKDGTKKYWCLRVFNRHADVLLRLIAPYVPTCMRYKLALQLGGIPSRLVGSKIQTLLGLQTTCAIDTTIVRAVRSYTPKSYEDYLVYNLEIEDNHNYFANGALVANSVLRESQTIKSEGPDPQPNAGKAWPSQHREVWSAIQTGRPFPMPKTTFAFQKFISMMKAAGINVEKKGHEFIASPLTDKQVLALSAGAVKDAGRVVTAKLGKDGLPIPLKGGIFDEQVTGGHGGTRFSHIPLAEPMPNPVYEPAIKSLLGLTGPQYEAIIYGDQGVHPHTGQLVAASEGISGGAGIKHLLSRIDVAKQLAETKTRLKSASTANVDKLLKQAKYLAALQELKMKPEEAYVLHNLPVLPPVMRPISILPSGDINTADMNELYKAFGQINQKLGDPLLSKSLSDQKKAFMRKDLYGSLSALLGVGVPYADQQHKGLLHQLGGASPKTSYVQDKLVSRRQDLSMRGVITPEPALGLDEVSLPRMSALTLFRPFLVHQLQVQGTSPNPLEAQKLLAEVHKGKDNSQVWKALDTVLETRPVLLKRDPVLHKYGIQGFKAKVHEGNTIKIHPLICSGFSADFDGDAMAVYVPVTPEAVADARKMMPSNNLFSEATGKIMYQPSNEAAMGLFRTTMVGETTIRTKFDSPKAVLDQLDKGAIKHTDQVLLNGKRTTAGRILLSERLPASYHEQALHDFSFQLNKAGIEKLYTELGTQHRHEFGQWADKIKDLGYDAATGIVRSSTLAGPVSIGAHTLSLKDIAPAKGLRDAVFDAAKKQEASIRADSSVPAGDKDRRVVDTWIRADEQVKKQYQAGTNEHSNNLALLWKSGVKPGWAQLKQITLSPTLVMDSRNKVIPTAITKSYTEGLDLAGYWTQMHGARRGAVMKTMEVREPGYLSKLLQNTSMDIQVTKEDCGTTAGVAMSLQEPDVSGRYLQAEYKGGGFSLPAGTLLTPSLVTKIRTADKGARLLVRSPLKCALPHGLCQKCAGLGAMDQVHPMGTNLGVISAHALGERAVQLPLKSFHGGGTVGSDAKGVNAFVRFQQLTEMPKKIPNAASLAMTSGTVEAVTEDRTGVRVRIGGVEHFVGKDATGMALHKPLPDTAGRAQYKQWGGIAVGTKVEAGDHLSDPNRTNVNPHDFYAATKSIDKTRNFMVDEIHGLYSEEGLRRRNIETVVRAMTNLTEVHDPGDHGSAMRGERFPLSYVQHLNATELKGKNPIVHTPVLAGVDMLPLEMRSDWMAKLNHQRLSQTLQDAGALAQKSNVHGSHPIPSLMYGSEFGLAKHVKGKPGYEHLKDVPAHHY